MLLKYRKGLLKFQKAFSECKGLYAVIIPKTNTIKTIGSNAFEKFVNLTIMTSEK